MKSMFKKIMLFCSLLAAIFLPSCMDKKTNEAAQTEAKNEATVRAILAAMDAGEYAKFDQYCAADYQIYNPFLPQPGNLEVFKGLMAGQKAGFPDVKHEIVQIFAKGNMVCGRGVFSGTNTGSMQGNPPSGNQVSLPFIFTDEFNAEGKLKVRHVQFDTGAFNAQLMAGK
ncbi:MAG: ester cyclase [Saprospiraceae bacterium]